MRGSDDVVAQRLSSYRLFESSSTPTSKSIEVSVIQSKTITGKVVRSDPCCLRAIAAMVDEAHTSMDP